MSTITPQHWALFEASASGNLGRIKSLLDTGADINCRDEHGRTPVMVAAICNQTDAIALLIDLHADTHLVDRLGKSFNYYLDHPWSNEETQDIHTSLLKSIAKSAPLKQDDNGSGDDDAIGL